MKTLKLLQYIIFGILFFSNQSLAQECEVASGRITTEGSTSVCVNDGENDKVMVSVQGNTGVSGWIITDDTGTILGLPDAPPFNFEGVPLGTCVIWHVSSKGELEGLKKQEKIFLIEGCYDLSNPIAIFRYNTPSGGQIATIEGETELQICAGDGEPDPFTVELTDAEGEHTAWVITDDNLNILGLPAGPTFDLEGAGAGTCLVWHLSWNGDLIGAEVGMNAANLSGCFALSNPITVYRSEATAAKIETTDGLTELSICAGDGEPDPFTVEVTGGSGDNAIWVITDTDLNILGTPPGPTFDLDGAGPGKCLVWYLNYADGVNLDVTNAADLEGCFALSNPITVYRSEASAAKIETTDGLTELSICAGDGEPDPFTVEVNGGSGDNAIWVITDADLNILGTPPGPTFDLDGAGPGKCLVWYLNYADGVNLDVTNAADLEGCFALSNPITVYRQDAATCGTTCMSPINLNLVQVRRRIARIDWDDTKDAFFYYTRYREVGSDNWYYSFNVRSKATLTRLTPNTDYEAQVLAYCRSGEYSDWSEPIFFTTLSSGNNNQAFDEVEDLEVPQLNIYPNPVGEQLNLETNLTGDKVGIQIHAIDGKLMRNLTFRENEFSTLDLTNLQEGTYTITITNSIDKVSKTFIKR